MHSFFLLLIFIITEWFEFLWILQGLSSRALEDSRLKQGGQGRGRRGTSTGFSFPSGSFVESHFHKQSLETISPWKKNKISLKISALTWFLPPNITFCPDLLSESRDLCIYSLPQDLYRSIQVHFGSSRMRYSSPPPLSFQHYCDFLMHWPIKTLEWLYYYFPTKLWICTTIYTGET